MSTPYRIQTIINQMGGRGINGALAYIGASQLTYKERDDGTKPDPSYFDSQSGSLFFDVGLAFKVNMKRGQTWKMAVAYEPSDTYTVYLIKCYGPAAIAKTNRLSEIKATSPDVYCDNLQAVVEAVYDEFIEKENGGFIPLY